VKAMAFRSWWLCAALCVVLAPPVLAQKEQRKTIDFPDELSDQVQEDFELADCFQEGNPPVAEQTTTEQLNITATTSTVLLITGTGSCLANGNNFPFLVYAKFGNNWRKILRGDGSFVQILPSMTIGWHDLEVTYRSSQSETVREVFRFNKAEYREAICETLSYPKNSDKPQRKPCPGWEGKKG